jgi:hypothetical protein
LGYIALRLSTCEQGGLKNSETLHGLFEALPTCPQPMKQAVAFLKKAPQKTFAPGCFNTARSGAKKFFGYFFSKK